MTKETYSHLASQFSFFLSMLEKSQFLREMIKAQESLVFYNKVEGHFPSKISAEFWLFLQITIHEITTLFLYL